MSKPLVFISYAHEDEDVAIRLRDWIGEALLGGIDFFVAGDRGSIPLGSEWPRRIAEALRTCSAALLVLSPTSTDRNWVYFEAGAAFGRDVPVIPVCCSGLSRTALTPPLSFLQAVEVPGTDDERRLLAELARLCGLRAPTSSLPLHLEVAPRNVPVEPATEKQKPDVMGTLFEENRFRRLVLEWRDKILGKIEVLADEGVSDTDAKSRLGSYLERLMEERTRYIVGSKEQLKTLPESIKRDHPEGGLAVALGIAGTTVAFTDHIKASEALLEVLPRIAGLCRENATTISSLKEQVGAVFADLLFEHE